MAQKMGFRSVNTETYEYIESSGGSSIAFGFDAGTGTFNVNTSSLSDISPDESTSNIAIDPAVNGNIIIHSNGNGITQIGTTSGSGATTILSPTGGITFTAANGPIVINSGTGTLGISTDTSATTVSIANGVAVKTVVLGSTNSTSATTVQSGSGALNITSTNGALTVNSGTGALGVSTDASATTVSFATGAAVKTVTLGSTNTTSSTAIKSGSGNVAINSGLTVDSTGRMTNGVQPMVLALLSGSTAANVTGDNTLYQVICNSEIFDIGSNYNNSTGVFTAPVTGKYLLTWSAFPYNMGAAHTTQIAVIATTARNYITSEFIWTTNTLSQAVLSGSVIANMTAADTATFNIQVAGSTKTVGAGGTSCYLSIGLIA